MVRHPAGLAAGEQGQAAPLTPEQARRLLSGPGREATAHAAQLDLSAAARLASAEAMRHFGPELGPLALEQALLRERARSKHPDGDRLWWTGTALEQATAAPVAAWRARGFDRPVLDLCCSVGGDLLALPSGSVGVDTDQARLLLARANAQVLGRDVRLVCADATLLRLPRGADLFVDPSRRAGGRRVFDARAYAPPLEQVLSWRAQVRSLTVKVAPGVDFSLLPPDVEVELVSRGGEVKEAVLRAGAARRGMTRSAALLPAGLAAGRVAVLAGRGLGAPPVRPPGEFLLEPDGAVVRAHLVAEVVEQVDGWLLDATIAYVAADALVATPFGRWYRVLEVLPFGRKALRARLRAHDAGPLVVKKRGTAVEPETLRRQLRLTGGREVTVVLTRSAGRQVALIVEPLSRLPGSASVLSAAQPPEHPPDAAGDA